MNQLKTISLVVIYQKRHTFFLFLLAWLKIYASLKVATRKLVMQGQISLEEGINQGFVGLIS